MSQDKRQYPRIEVPMPVIVSHTEKGSLELITADVCDGGVFLKADNTQLLPVGTQVTLQVKAGLLAGDNPPLLNAVIVRTTSEGMGLKFL